MIKMQIFKHFFKQQNAEIFGKKFSLINKSWPFLALACFIYLIS